MTDRAETPAGPGAQRIDRWLWFARFFKSRALAAKMVDGGKVRLTRAGQTAILAKPSNLVRAGDVLTFTAGLRVIVVRVKDTGTRRGPAPEAQLLYDDLSPPPPARPRPAGPRPTKKDRRLYDRFTDPDGKG